VSLALLLLCGNHAALAQSVPDPRGPQFLLASASPSKAPVVVEAGSVASLRRRVSLSLDGARVGEALAELSRVSGLQIVYADGVVPSEGRVHFRAEEITVAAALTEVLLDAGVDVLISPGGSVVLVKRGAVQTGSVAGRVTDAKTGQGIPGASVSLDGTRWRATTDENGAYRLVEVTPGTYTLTASRIGYTRQSKSVTVAAGQEATLDVRLEVSASPLDAVVVTGTMVPTEVKALPTPISVITAEDIERQNLQRVDQVFRGQVPGAVAWDLGPVDYNSVIAVRGASTLSATPGIKTFVDGVEVADPQFIALINPSDVDRIEILRGPQASTLYGAGALNGVMQIFTKKGHFGLARPVVSGKFSAGGVGGLEGSGTAPQTDNSISIVGGGGQSSYSVAGSYRHVGEWVPNYNSTNWSASAGGRTTQGPLEIASFASYSSKTFDYPWNTQLQSYSYFSQPPYQTNLLREQTYGITASLQATQNWRHTLTVGYDQTYWTYYQTRARFTTPADTFLNYDSYHQAKASVLYHTDLSLDLGNRVLATVTAGANNDSYDAVTFFTGNATRTAGSLDGSTFPYAIGWTNTGYFGQVQFGVADRLFFTAGIRAERNANFGTQFGTAWSPRIGGSYSVPLGTVAAKVRVSYGESIRAPNPLQRDGVQAATYEYLANPNLGPERQRGVDGGIELYFGQKASLAATYYNQRAIDLIQLVTVPPPPGDTLPTSQYQNIARVGNQGWEFEGSLTAGLIHLVGTYSITHSTVQQLAPGYPAGGYQVGDPILAVPHSSAGATATYSPLSGTRLTASVTYIGHWIENDYLALFGFYFGGQPYRGSTRGYWMQYPAVTKFAIGISQQLAKSIGAFVRFENLGNNLRYEANNYNIPMSRSVMVGATLDQ